MPSAVFGLGLGLLLASMAMFIFTGDPPRGEIERRARALGMDYRDAFTQETSGKTAVQPAPSSSGEKTVREVVVVIPDQSSAQEVGEALAKVGLVASAGDFVDRVKEANLTTSLVAGVYRFPEGIKVEDIIKAMSRK